MERFNKFTTRIAAIYRCIQRLKSIEMEKLGLKSTFVTCIYYLYHSPHGTTLKKICEISNEDKAAISRALKELESLGIVSLNKEKKYKQTFFLTEYGMNVGQIIDKKAQDLVDLASLGITKKNREVLYKLLDIISYNLQNLCDKGE